MSPDPMNNDDFRGEWNEYSRLVLAELERHNLMLSKMDEKLDAIKIEQAIYEREISGLKSELIDVKAVQHGHNDRITKIEVSGQTTTKIRQARRDLISGIVGFVVAFMLAVIPSVIDKI